MVRSATINSTAQPHWNSTHYLCLRKRQLEKQPDAVVTISVYDDDSHDGVLSVLDSIDKDDYLGQAVFDLDAVKAPGVHDMALELSHQSSFRWHTPTVNFTVEFMSLKDALSEMGKDKAADVWDEVNGGLMQQEIHWPQLANLTYVGDIPLDAVAFINVPRTGSQVSQSTNQNFLKSCPRLGSMSTNNQE
ncbi:MAG: C2 domain-containing protein [Gammaproteobacteria bacterium]|nr:C2 domain-containing protein [Gammaproteobacteria bacterium]